MSAMDRIEKHVMLRASQARVWKALTEPREFGEWFGASLSGEPFVEGAVARGPVTHKGYEHMMLELHIERVEPKTYLAYRWHPHAADPDVDYSSEPMTLVEFTLADDGSGATSLTIVESGFDRLSAQRRAEVFPLNDRGWSSQAVRIEKYVTA